MSTEKRPNPYLNSGRVERLVRIANDQATADNSSKKDRCHRIEYVVATMLAIKQSEWLQLERLKNWEEACGKSKYPGLKKRIRRGIRFVLRHESRKVAYDWAAAANAYLEINKNNHEGLAFYLMKHGVTRTMYKARGKLAEVIAERAERHLERSRSKTAPNIKNDVDDDPNQQDPEEEDKAEADQSDGDRGRKRERLKVEVSSAARKAIERLNPGTRFWLSCVRTDQGIDASRVRGKR